MTIYDSLDVNYDSLLNLYDGEEETRKGGRVWWKPRKKKQRDIEEIKDWKKKDILISLMWLLWGDEFDG